MLVVPGTYNLITFSSGSGLGGLTFTGGGTTLNQNGETFKLASAAGAEQLSIIAPPVAAYWTGAQGSSWSTLVSGSSTNWGSTASGPDTNYLPGGISNVFFTASGAANYAATTLDGNFSVNSLTFNNSGAVGIAAGTPATSTLTLAGTRGMGGISVNPGAGTVTISAPLALATSQTWTNNSSNSLTISGSVANGGNTLTLAGSGVTTFSGSHRRQRRNRRRRQRPGCPCCHQRVHGPDHGQRRNASLTGSGTILGSTSVVVNAGGRFYLNNSTTLVSNRVGDSAGVTLNGGTFSMLGNNSSPSVETVGALTLGPGASTIDGLARHRIGQGCRAYFRQQHRCAVRRPLVDSQRRQHGEHYRHDSRAGRPRRQLYRGRDHHAARRLRSLRRGT